jgi:hypothetical protein
LANLKPDGCISFVVQRVVAVRESQISFVVIVGSTVRRVSMKTRISAVQLSVQMASIALGLSSVGLAWHIEGAMTKTADTLPASGAADNKTPAKAQASADGSRDAGSNQGVHYDVVFLPGGIDRAILTKRDDARSLCIQVTLDSPPLDVQRPTTAAVQLPPNWALERAILVRDPTACRGTLRRFPAGAIDASEASGSVRWGNSPTEGTVVDLKLSFPSRGAEPAFTEQLSFKR